MRTTAFAAWAAVLALLTAWGAFAGSEAQSARDRQRELNYEYAKLYGAMNGLRLLDELLLVKMESKETEKLVEQIAAFGARTKTELEDLAKANPEVSLEEDGRTNLSKESSKRQKRDRMKTFAPVTGVSGPDFERMLLLGQQGVLYQLRFRAEVMAEAETDAKRRAYLRGVQKDVERLYIETVKLLDKRYYKGPAHTPLGAIGGDD